MLKIAHPGSNGILNSLPDDQRQLFLDGGEVVTLAPGKVLTDSEQAIRHVYFPVTAVISVLSVMANRVGVETAVVGYEGMAPLAAFHQVDSAAEQIMIQVPGDVIRIPRQEFHIMLAQAPAMRGALHRYSQALFTFAAQSSACNRQHTVVQRCARWLLTTHDRVPGDDFYLTHLFLSQMLGVRRSSVTIAAEVLRAAGAITYTRGRVRVIDRTILHERCCECYAIVRSTYDRLLAGRPTPSPLATLELSDGETSLIGAGDVSDQTSSPAAGVPRPEDSFTEFSTRLREGKRRSEELRALTDAPEGDASRAALLRLSDELSTAFEQLEVAEEEMRAQMQALEEMQLAMQTQHQEWRARFDGLPDAFIETDQDEVIIEMNRAAEDIIGKPRGRVVGKPIVSLFPDTDRRSLRDVIGRLKKGAGTAQWSGTLIAANASRPDVEVTVAATSTVASIALRGESHGKSRGESHGESRGMSAGMRYLGARWLLRAKGSGRIAG